MTAHDLSGVLLNGHTIEPGSWYTLTRSDLSSPLRVTGGPHSEAHARALMARAPEAARLGTVFDAPGHQILAALTGAHQSAPSLQSLSPDLTPAGRAGTSERSAELPLDVAREFAVLLLPLAFGGLLWTVTGGGL